MWFKNIKILQKLLVHLYFKYIFSLNNLFSVYHNELYRPNPLCSLVARFRHFRLFRQIKCINNAWKHVKILIKSRSIFAAFPTATESGLSISNVSNRTWHMRRMRNFRIIMRCPRLLNTLTHTAINLSGRH